MFTGLIEEVGSVVAIRADDRGTQLQIAAPRTAKKVESIALKPDQPFQNILKKVKKNLTASQIFK